MPYQLESSPFHRVIVPRSSDTRGLVVYGGRAVIVTTRVDGGNGPGP